MAERKVRIWVFILSFPLSKMTIMTMIDMSSSGSALLFCGLFYVLVEVSPLATFIIVLHLSGSVRISWLCVLVST